MSQKPIERRGEVLQAISEIPNGKLFRASDVSYREPVVLQALKDLTSDSKSGIKLLGEGIYMKGTYYSLVENSGRVKEAMDDTWFFHPTSMELAFLQGGPGSGLAGVSAPYALGWIWQSPCYHQVAVVGKKPRSLDRTVYRRRYNRRRRCLTWAEVTLMEAARAQLSGYTCDTILAWMADGTSIMRLGSKMLSPSCDGRIWSEQTRWRSDAVEYALASELLLPRKIRNYLIKLIEVIPHGEDSAESAISRKS